MAPPIDLFEVFFNLSYERMSKLAYYGGRFTDIKYLIELPAP